MTEPADQRSGSPPDETAQDCPLGQRDQNINALIFALQISLIYLSAPTLYVGFVQAGLCKHLQTSDTLANLPSTVFLGMAWSPLVVVWLYPQARLLKAAMAWAFGAAAVMSVVLAALLVARPSGGIIIAALLAHAAVVGCVGPLTNILKWEALNRGVSLRLRGKALALAYGVGPAFAVVGSLGAQLLLDGKLFGWTPPAALTVGYPDNYAMLFGVSAVCMGLAGFLTRCYRIPLPAVDSERESFQTAVIGGFRSFARNRVLLYACIAYLLVYSGNMVQINMSIFTQEAVGRMSADLAGYQLALRFGFKILAGVALGWLLSRTNAKVPLLVTVGLQIVGVLWVLLVPGYWFLLAFGINGAGELFGVYYTNYPVQGSPQSQVRRNIAFVKLMSSFVGIAPVFYGWISDTWSLRTSFGAALVLLVGTMIFVALKLPANPQSRR